MILILVPEKGWAQPFLEKAETVEKFFAEENDCCCLRCGREPFLLAVTGYGKVNTALQTARAIHSADVSALLAVGICGRICQRPCMPPSAAIPCSTFQGDVDMTALGCQRDCRRSTFPQMRTGLYHTDEELNDRLCTACIKKNTAVLHGRMAGLEQLLTNEEQRDFLRRAAQAETVDDNSGAVGQLAEVFRLPFAVLKVVSYHAGTEAPLQWMENHTQALGLAAEIALDFLAG